MRALHPRSGRPRAKRDGSPDVALVGYCFGGLLSLMAAAADPDLPLASLTTIATPVDFTDAGVLTEALKRGDLKVDEVLDEDRNILRTCCCSTSG